MFTVPIKRDEQYINYAALPVYINDSPISPRIMFVLDDFTPHDFHLVATFKVVKLKVQAVDDSLGFCFSFPDL